MTTIYERVETAIKSLNIPYAEGVYITESGDLPDVFIAYSLLTDVATQHADDDEVSRTSLIQVTYFSRAGLNNIPNISSVMKGAGFLPGDKRELAYDRETKHFGIALDYRYNEEV